MARAKKVKNNQGGMVAAVTLKHMEWFMNSAVLKYNIRLGKVNN